MKKQNSGRSTKVASAPAEESVPSRTKSVAVKSTPKKSTSKKSNSDKLSSKKSNADKSSAVEASAVQASPAQSSPVQSNLEKVKSGLGVGRAIDPEARYAMVAREAYLCAEKRGFARGGELADWLEAERKVARMLG